MSKADPLFPLFANNRAWAERMQVEHPGFFARLAQQQKPRYLWIGCADSRVPANELIGLLPGEVFVHRNVANLIIHSDLNALSTLQFAVDLLQVEHIIVCGHYGCAGVSTVLRAQRVGLADNWLQPIHDLYRVYRNWLGHFPPEACADKLCELNIATQVMNAAHTTVVRDAWARGQPLTLHGWVYRLQDGRLRDLGLSANGLETLEPLVHDYLARPDLAV